jgi:hypothetical protein
MADREPVVTDADTDDDGALDEDEPVVQGDQRRSL